MSNCTTDILSSKIVISVCDGRRLGYICNYEIDPCDGKICAIFVPGEPTRIFSRAPELRIPYDKIKKIGEDAILVEIAPGAARCECARDNPGRKRFFGIF